MASEKNCKRVKTFRLYLDSSDKYLYIYTSQFINDIMKIIVKIQEWGDHHHPKCLDFFRILLGVVLIWKGIEFKENLHAFTTLIQGGIGATVTASLIAHTIIVVHVIGGFLIALGTRTRLWCLIVLPVPVFAVLWGELRNTLLTPYSQPLLTFSVLFALIFFLIEGDGVLSIDHHREVKV